MGSLVRISFKNLTRRGLKFLDSQNSIKLVRTISSKTNRTVEGRSSKPAPWPYNEKSYTLLNYFFDKTTSRFDENSKIIVVEGPVAVGKSKLAKQLAEELDMYYLPEANLDMTYINNYGYDLRKLDAQLPEDCRSFDVMDFLKNPRHRHTARFQIQQYQTRYSQYIDALAHVFSTGQGVVLDRCAYSDFVFVEAMYGRGFLSKKAYKKYYEFRDNTIVELLRPHLIIYLDIPVSKVLENIEKRAINYEKNSPVLTADYLSLIEKNYKQNYLKQMSYHSELLVYDWSEEGDLEIVIEDVERIDFNRYDVQDPKLKDWQFESEQDYAYLRHMYADRKDILMSYNNIPCWDVPELIVDALEAKTYYTTLAEAPGEKYETGFNKELGDTNLLFKLWGRQRDTLPLRERRKV